MANVKKEIIEEIIKVAKRMDTLQMMNVYSGNISVYDDGLLYVTPTTKSKADYTPDMIAVIDDEGNQIAGTCKPTSEYKMHRAIYPLRDDIHAVIHTHSPFLTAFAVDSMPVKCDGYAEAIMLLGEVPVAPYGQPGTTEIYKGVEPLIQDHNVVLLENHGVLAVGDTLEKAAFRAEGAEAVAKVIAYAKLLGTPKPIPEEELAKLR